MSSNGNQNSGGQTQTTGPGTITSPNADTRTLNSRGTEVGSANVTRAQNDTGRFDSIVRWTVPKKYRQVVIAGGKHYTKAELRTVESITGTTNDDTVVSLNTNIVPIAGEEQLVDQPFDVVVAYNVTQETRVDIANVDYIANEVTLGTDPADGDTVKLWPVISEGQVKYAANDAFGNEVGPLDEWGQPVHVFADFDQEKNQTQIYLPGAARFERDESFELKLNAPRQVVWSDPDWPTGGYVSSVEQRVDVLV